MERLAHSKTTAKRNDHERKKARKEVDHFQRLPDELVVLIFAKVYEAKWLFMCYLVSSRFASLVIQIDRVSVKILGWRRKFLSAQRYSLILSMVDNFLKKFACIQSLLVEVIIDESPNCGEYSQLFKWKAIGCHKSFILITTKKVFPKIDNDDDDKTKVCVSIASQYSRDELHSVVKRAADCFNDSRIRYLVLEMIIVAIPNLKEVVVQDSLNEGQIFVGRDDLDIMRRPSFASETYNGTQMKLWVQPLVKQPLFGLAMEGVMLLIVKGIGIDDVSIAKNAFVETYLCEAAMEMLKKEPLKVKQCL